ncbi:MAG: hypothetical protein WB973_20535, partial [Thermoanaerobaculia bacterium]
TSAAGQALTFALPGGYTLTSTLKVSGGPVTPSALPTYSAAYLGSTGHYSGVSGEPALYQSTLGTTTTASLTEISMTDSTGAATGGYALVSADAESTDQTESITWTASSPLTSLTATPSGNGIGNSCGGAYTGIGTTTVTCIGSGFGPRTGTPILAARTPTVFSQQMVGAGQQAIAFGVLVATIALTKTVVNRLPGDEFRVTASSADGSVLGTGDTGGGDTASTGQITVLTSGAGETYTFTETATAGRLSNYDGTWTCTRNGASDPALPTGDAGPTATVLVGIGDFVRCTITNTAKSNGLHLSKKAGTPVDVNGDGLVDAGDTISYTFTVTNTGTLTLHDIGVTDSIVGPVTCPQDTLAAGESQTCQGDQPYTITEADVDNGAVLNTATAHGTPPGGTAPIDSNQATTRTPTQKPSPALTLTKTATPHGPDDFEAGQLITYHFTVTNTGNVPLTDITVADTAFTGHGQISAVSCPGTTLAPDATMTCTATYSLTDADVADPPLTITNTATATGTAP